MKKIKVIAEIGVNHNGKISLAKKLINFASLAKADFVKFQIFKTDHLTIKNSKKAKYQSKNLNNDISQYKMLKNYELNDTQLNLLIKHCKKKKIEFLASCFDVDSVKRYLRYKPKYIKIPSGEITNHQLLEFIGSKKKKIILSTGMSKMQEVKKAVDLIIKSGTKRKNITVLQCTSDYPAKLKDTNLNCIKSYKEILKTNIGFSDHTIGDAASLVAVALGAVVIEKHITINKKMKGPDHLASMEYKDFKKFVGIVKKVPLILGKKIKTPSKNELNNLKYVRKSFYAKEFIKKGNVFSYNNVIAKRPCSGGIPANKILKILGKISKKNFHIDEKITL